MQMTENWQQRTCLLLGEEKTERLHRAHVLVVGLGGVGAYAAEMLCRAGVGRLTLVDADTVQPTNLNRQLPALHSTLGQPKAEVLAARFRDINPEVQLDVRTVFLKDEDIPALLDEAPYDFVVDAIDTLAPKCHLIADANPLRRPVGHVPLRPEQGRAQAAAEDGDTPQGACGVQHRTGRPPGRDADGRRAE